MKIEGYKLGDLFQWNRGRYYNYIIEVHNGLYNYLIKCDKAQGFRDFPIYKENSQFYTDVFREM